jgi:hypothetical protein
MVVIDIFIKDLENTTNTIVSKIIGIDTKVEVFGVLIKTF